MPTFDAITLELMWSRLISIAQDQARALVQASFTSAVGEMEDMASGIYDSHGNIIAQGVTGTQGVLIGLTRGIKHMLAAYPPTASGSGPTASRNAAAAARRAPRRRLEPGDVLISNDPWMFSGHKFDISIAMPVFLDGAFVGMTGTISHGADIGGIKSSGDSEEVYDEGLNIPIVKFYKAGKRNDDVFEMIGSNVRLPHLVMGDLMAQVAACEVGARKLAAFMREYGLRSLDALSAEIMRRTEAAVKRAIGELPDGAWTTTSTMDGIDEPLQVRATMTVRGAAMTIDFTGTSPQTRRGGINAVTYYTDAYVYHAVKTALTPEAPNNEGLFRSIAITAPPGCLVNAIFPAPVMSRFMMIPFISSAVFGCLAQALPGRVLAECGVAQMQLLSGHTEVRTPFVYWLMGNGGMGARPGMDGCHATSFPGNVGNAPVEIIENVSPVHVLSRRLVADSGGAGKWRGGCDLEIAVTVASEHPAFIHCFFERTTQAAVGYQGGRPGRCAVIKVNGVDIPPKRKHRLLPGDVLTYSSAGGGGLLPPEERDPEAVLDDVLEGYVSVEAARRDYKVALHLANRAIDAQETNKLRRPAS